MQFSLYFHCNYTQFYVTFSSNNVVWFAAFCCCFKAPLRSFPPSLSYSVSNVTAPYIWTRMPSEACAHMTQVKGAMCFMVRQDGNRRSRRGLMFQHTIRTAAYQLSAKKPRWSLNVMTLHWHQAVENTVEEYKSPLVLCRSYFMKQQKIQVMA